MEWLPDLDWTLVAHHVRDLAIAYVLALPIGWDREKYERTAGLRTFPLVSLAACGYTLVGFGVLSSTEAEGKVIQGIITGIGFIGGGAIVKNVIDGQGIVSGTATAASLWTTGAVGVAVAAGRVEVALVLSFLTFTTFRLMSTAKQTVSRDEEAQ